MLELSKKAQKVLNYGMFILCFILVLGYAGSMVNDMITSTEFLKISIIVCIKSFSIWCLLSYLNRNTLRKEIMKYNLRHLYIR